MTALPAETGRRHAGKANAAATPKVKYRELELVECFHRLSRAEQEALLQVARSMARNKPAAMRWHDVQPISFGERRQGGWGQ
ncbi:hypothetical protein [Sphingomonas tagetis]|uniref:hypothetical protein n=1 Tax=Sphingomonas tagetis TaxID=2949092 RepID=UPI0020B7D99F|nr:hypothetical protein [Sphingomonas tagetis]